MGLTALFATCSSTAPVLSRELWLLVHADLRRLARIAAVIGWVEQVLQKTQRGR